MPRLTLEQIERLFENDPEAARRYLADQELLRQEQIQLNTADSAELLRELAAVGIGISSIDDLVNTRRAYEAAIPVLTRHLFVEHRPNIRCAIIRALITEDAKTEAVWNALQTVFLRDTDQSENGVKWTAAWALANLAAPDKLAILQKWADDPTHAVASQIFQDRLSKRTRFQAKRRRT